jgi:hypothetical protein
MCRIMMLASGTSRHSVFMVVRISLHSICHLNAISNAQSTHEPKYPMKSDSEI